MEVVEEGDGPDGVVYVSSATTKITEDTPVLQPSDCVLDARPPSAMTAPGVVAENPVASKARRDELGDAAIAAVSQDASMLLTASFDARTAIVHAIVSIAWTASADRNDTQIAAADEHLGIARPAVVLRACGMRVITSRDERAVHDP